MDVNAFWVTDGMKVVAQRNILKCEYCSKYKVVTIPTLDRKNATVTTQII